MNYQKVLVSHLSENGEGVGYLDSQKVYIDGALPNEEVLISIYETRKNYCRAKIVKILLSSPDRVVSPCNFFPTCGGCQLLHLDYTKQLLFKQKKVEDSLHKSSCPCIASKQEHGYRHKLQIPRQEGVFGLYKKDSHTIVPIDHCIIHSELGERIFLYIKKRVENSHFLQELTHLVIRTTFYTEEAFVVFVARNFSSSFKEFALELEKAFCEIKVVGFSLATDSNTILSHKFEIFSKKDHIEENFLGLTLSLSLGSFFQMNVLQAEKLYAKVLEFADLKKEDRVLDAYCGIGALSMLLAKEAKEVIGIELFESAIADAKKNALKNQIANCQFIAGKVEEMISFLQTIDVVILNPPRKGCDEKFLYQLDSLRPRKVVYVSCELKSLSRDLEILQKIGYKIFSIQPFDMFPQTVHVETVVSLTR